MFPEHKKLDLAKICSEVNSIWQKENIFNKSVQSRSEKNQFVFYVKDIIMNLIINQQTEFLFQEILYGMISK